MLRFNKRQPRNSRIRKNVEEQAIYRNPIACGKRSGLAGLGNALRTVAALLLMCDPRDLGVAFSEEPNLYLYDCYPGGVGQSAPLYRMAERLVRLTSELLAACNCEAGCPSCVGAPGEVGERGKEAAMRIARELLTGS